MCDLDLDLEDDFWLLEDDEKVQDETDPHPDDTLVTDLDYLED
jgi:hypothetical protein